MIIYYIDRHIYDLDRAKEYYSEYLGRFQIDKELDAPIFQTLENALLSVWVFRHSEEDPYNHPILVIFEIDVETRKLCVLKDLKKLSSADDSSTFNDYLKVNQISSDQDQTGPKLTKLDLIMED
jgi:hypothetical protein